MSAFPLSLWERVRVRGLVPRPAGPLGATVWAQERSDLTPALCRIRPWAR